MLLEGEHSRKEHLRWNNASKVVMHERVWGIKAVGTDVGAYKGEGEDVALKVS